MPWTSWPECAGKMNTAQGLLQLGTCRVGHCSDSR